MKVDKAVCTSGDIYYNNLSTTENDINSNDLNSIIKFEQVFTTLVENKILAIKRECEQNESKRKARTIKNILFGKTEKEKSSVFDTTTEGVSVHELASADTQNENDDGKDKKSHRKYKNFFVYTNKKKEAALAKEIDIERGEKPLEAENELPINNANDDFGAENVSECQQIVKAEVRNANEVQNQYSKEPSTANRNSLNNQNDLSEEQQQVRQTNLDSQLNCSINYTNTSNIDEKCDKLINSHTDNAQIPISSIDNDNNNNDNDSIANRHNIVNDYDESLATTIDISLQQTSLQPPPLQQQYLTIDDNDLQQNNIKIVRSDLALHDDGASSQNTSDIEFSLVSETISINELPLTSSKRPVNTNVLSDPIVKVSSNLLSPQPIIKNAKQVACKTVSGDDNINQYHVARRAISAQSTPIFARHSLKMSDSGSEGGQKKSLKFQTDKALICDEKKHTETAKTQTIVTAPTPSAPLTTSVLAKPSSTLPDVHHSKKSQKHHNKFKDIAIEYEIDYDEGAPSPRGFISSFNQLTSNIPPAAVITTTRKQSMKQQKKAQQVKDANKNQQESIKLKQITEHSKTNETKVTNSFKDNDNDQDRTVEDVGTKKKKRKSMM
jgi:hypothetical protein